MWGTITESETWFDYLSLFMKDLIRRKLALDDTTPLDDFIEIETDNGMCEASVSFSDISILNMNRSRAGNLYNDTYYIDDIFNDIEKRPNIDIRLSLFELEKYNSTVVLPLYTNSLLFKGVLDKENNLSFIFQDATIELDNSFKNLHFVDKLVIFDRRLDNFNSQTINKGFINKKVIKHLYMNTYNYKVGSCYINNLYTTITCLNNFDSCIINSAKILHVLDFDDFMNGVSISSDLSILINRLSYLHKLNNKKGLDLVTSTFNLPNYLDKLKERETSVVSLSNDKLYLYLCDEHDDSGYFYYFDLMLDDYLKLLSDKFSVFITDIKLLDINNKVVSLRHKTGLEVIIILSSNSCRDMYSLIFNGEMSKYI